jgi:hypothetical protein
MYQLPRCFIRIIISTVLLLSAAVVVSAQFKASIQGTVTDSTGGLVPEVKITLTNKETGKTQDTASSSEGFYLISGLAPGLYKLTAEKAGFKQKVFEDVAVSAETVRGLDVALEAGDIAASVTVSQDTETRLETENASENARDNYSRS